jgi:hypothetical protein
VPTDPKISEFIDKALAAGIPHNALVGMLTAEGWTEKAVYEALADHYRLTAGLEIPHRTSAGTPAKDAFFYLLIFGTLAVWTFAVGALSFTLIDQWLADPLFASSMPALDIQTITSCLAAIIVAFPLFLLLSRATLHDTAAHPEKQDSGIRKWLTYMALVIAAATFIGDLIGVIDYLLQGELTSRFMAKSFVVLALSGGVFFYYFGGLRKSTGSTTGFNRNKSMAALSSAVIVVMLIFGFLALGSPRVQRDLRADGQRIQNIHQLSINIGTYWKSHNSQLPPSLDSLSPQYYPYAGDSAFDPISHARYEYHAKQGSQYELCASFVRKSPRQRNQLGPDAWAHPAGHYCFELDASIAPPFMPPYYLY